MLKFDYPINSWRSYMNFPDKIKKKKIIINIYR